MKNWPINVKQRQRGLLLNPFRFGGGASSPPKLETTSTYTTGGASLSTHNVTLPSGIVAGDFLVAAFYNDTSATASASGWTTVGTANRDSAGDRLTVFSRIATGSDTLSVITSSAQEATCVVARISGADTIQFVAADYFNVSTIDIPAITPSGGLKPYLFIAGTSVVYNIVLTAGPAGYATQITALSGLSTDGSEHHSRTAYKAASLVSSESGGSFTCNFTATGSVFRAAVWKS